MFKNKSVPFFADIKATLDKATLDDGSDLPDWLSFDPDTLTFSGTPSVTDSEIIDVNVTATDSANQSVSLDFNLNVGNVSYEHNQWREAV